MEFCGVFVEFVGALTLAGFGNTTLWGGFASADHCVRSDN